MTGTESQNRRGTTACIIFFCTTFRSGYHILREICYEIPPCRGNPDVTVLRVLRNSQTASDWANATPRLVGRPLAEDLGRSRAAADAVDEASRDDTGGLLGQRCFVLSSQTRTCVRLLPRQPNYVHLSGCAILVHITIQHQPPIVLAHPPTFKPQPPIPSLPTPTPSPSQTQPPSPHHAPPFSNPSTSDPSPRTWTLGYLQTCARCNLHTCIRAHVHTFNCLVSTPARVSTVVVEVVVVVVAE